MLYVINVLSNLQIEIFGSRYSSEIPKNDSSCISGQRLKAYSIHSSEYAIHTKHNEISHIEGIFGHLNQANYEVLAKGVRPTDTSVPRSYIKFMKIL